MNKQIDVEVLAWEGREIVVWRFASYTEFQAFMMFASSIEQQAWTAELFPDRPERMWGAIYRGLPMTAANAVAVMHIDEEEAPDYRLGHWLFRDKQPDE